MYCKSCHTPLEDEISTCPSCGIAKPRSMNARKKMWLIAGAVTFVILIIIIPMIASLLWMQSN